jgi:hypothetical protein
LIEVFIVVKRPALGLSVDGCLPADDLRAGLAPNFERVVEWGASLMFAGSVVVTVKTTSDAFLGAVREHGDKVSPGPGRSPTEEPKINEDPGEFAGVRRATGGFRVGFCGVHIHY